MANYQRLKRTASGVVQGDPAVGELVLNTASGYLYTTRDDGALVLINNGPQGPVGPSGAVGPSGENPSPRYFGSFFDTTIQTNPSGTVANSVRLNTTDVASGVSLISGYLIQVANSGTYNVQISFQLEKTNANKENVDIWFAKNSVDIPWSNTQIVVEGSSAKQVAAWNTLINMNAKETAEIRWFSPDTNVRLVSVSGLTNPTRPSIPSVIVTVHNVN